MIFNAKKHSLSDLLALTDISFMADLAIWQEAVAVTSFAIAIMLVPLFFMKNSYFYQEIFEFVN